MSAAPGDQPTVPAVPNAPVPPAPSPSAPPAAPSPAAPSRPPRDPLSRALLGASAVLFFGWLAWLSYAALNKSREPIVSHAQAALAEFPVVAKVDADEKGAPSMKVTVIESLRPDGPAPNTALVVANLPSASGFTGAGDYLLLLVPDLVPDPLPIRPDAPVYQLVGARPSASATEPVPIYRWGNDVEAQARRLYREKPK